MKREAIDEFTLLCEKCGYVIEGLDREGVCPECGKPIVESLPERRVGTPSFLAVLRHPIGTFETLCVDAASMRVQNRRCAFAGLIAATATLVVHAALIARQWSDIARSAPRSGASGTALGWLMSIGVLLLVIAAVFLAVTLAATMLTEIERVGLRTLGRLRGFRITAEVARAIVATASSAWIMSGLALGGAQVLLLAEAPWTIIAFVAGAGAAIGLLSFELIAWLGLRRLRYANRMRPSESPSAQHVPTPRTKEPGA